jgi:Kdo2-lipid IVA lauroyltransferase/acyltransferase
MFRSPSTTIMREAQNGAVTRRVSGGPRWHGHAYNRASLYRLAEMLSVMPRGLRLSLARQVGWIALRVLPVERRAIQKALELVTGASGDRLDKLTADVFRNFAMCFADLVSTNRQSVARLASLVGSVSGAEQFDGLPEGIVSVTAHVGNWELAGRLLASRLARRTNVVVSPAENPELGRWVRRDGEGIRFVPRAHPSVGVELLAALRRGEVVALQADRGIGTGGDAWVPFFGPAAPFPLGPFFLASAAGVPVVPAFCVLDRGYRYAVRIAAPIVVRRGEEEKAARAWVAILESVVREHPTQWFNFFDAWNPFGAPPQPEQRPS